MTSLEIHYRRLLRVYPAGHRAAYEEEMIGVLMSAAEPGRRFPSPAEATDLLRAGLTARLGRTLHTQRGTGWRDAAGVTALFAALLLAGGAVSRLVTGLVLWGQGDPLRAHGVDGSMLLDPAARTVIWVMVVAAAVLGLRGTTVALAAVGVLIQAGTVWFWSAPSAAGGLHLVWGVAVALAVAGLFAVAVSGRWVRAVLGVRGLVPAVGGALLAAVTRVPAMDRVWSDSRFQGDWFSSADVLQYWLPGLLLAAGAWTAGRWVRGRTAVLSAAVLTVVAVSHNVPHVVAEVRYSGPATLEVVTAVLVLGPAPFVVLATGVTLLRVWESLAVRGHGHVRAHE